VNSLIAVGSIAYDTLETPFGRRDRALGGSAVHFSLAANLFTDVGVVGVVGDDFDGEPVLAERGIDTSGIQVVAGGTTFAWEGRYGFDLNVAETLDTRLGVFEQFDPQLSEEQAKAPVLFLGNIVPDLQRSVRKQSRSTR
jgi:sugar/nucleoside kinase (ribokinase family)